MSEAVSFWLDNKMSSGLKVAVIGNQTLVSYRERFYVVENGAARMKGAKPLRFSLSSMPSVWKKALKGITPVETVLTPHEEENLPTTTTTRKGRPVMEKIRTVTQDSLVADPQPVKQAQTSLRLPSSSISVEGTKHSPSAKRSESNPLPKINVVACCPYCRHKHDLPLDKGKNGKAFFVTCSKCKSDFAVRFVPVTTFQAQVAGFK